jgi:hypothetical protein
VAQVARSDTRWHPALASKDLAEEETSDDDLAFATSSMGLGAK